jgi:hypothetical protein
VPAAHSAAPDVEGTSVAVPGFVIEPALKLVPLICTVWNRFEYCVMFKPLDRVGRPAVPPGNVMVNVSPGATVSGPTIPIVMSCDWCRIVPFTFARQSTFEKVCVMVCADAGRLPNGMNRTTSTAVVAKSAIARRRLEPVVRINVPPLWCAARPPREPAT